MWKKICCTSLMILCLIVSAPPILAQSQHIKNEYDGYSDIDIKEESFTERQYSSVALSDKYGVELVTAQSAEWNRKIESRSANQMQALKDRLLINELPRSSPQETVQSKASELGLFSKDYSIIVISAASHDKSYSLLLPIGVVTVGASSGGGAAALLLWKRRRKEQHGQ